MERWSDFVRDGRWEGTFYGTKPSAVVTQHRTVGCENTHEDCRDAFAGVRRFDEVAFTERSKRTSRF